MSKADKNLHPRVFCVAHILGSDFDVSLLNEQAQAVVLVPDAWRLWPTQFAKIEVSVYGYLHLTGIYTDIPETETNTFRARVAAKCRDRGLLSDVKYGNNQHINLDKGPEFAEILIGEIEHEEELARAAGKWTDLTGFFVDNCYSSYGWLTKVADDDGRWEMFKREVLIRLHRGTGDTLIVNNLAYPAEQAVAGWMREGVPAKVTFPDALMSLIAEHLNALGGGEIILHESDGITLLTRRAIIAATMLFAGWYSPRYKTAAPEVIIPPGNAGRWREEGEIILSRRRFGHWHFENVFRHEDTGRRGLAKLVMTPDLSSPVDVVLPWEI